MSQDLFIVNTISNSATIITKSNSVIISSVGVQGPPGPVSGSYIFTQSSPASTWVINHNLGFKPSVSVFSIGGQLLEVEVSHTSVNQCSVYFVIATAGSARLI